MYLSIRDDVVFAAGYTELAAGLKDLGISAVELFVHKDDTVPALVPVGDKKRLCLTNPDEFATLQSQIQEHGITVAALCMGNNFNAEDKDFEVAWAVRTAESAQKLGVPAIRIDAIMHGEQELSLEERQTLVATMIKRILDGSSHTGVEFGIENHGFQGNDPEFLEGLLARVGSPRLGLTLDSGNFYWRGWPLSRVYEIFEQFAPIVKHTHIKNIQYPEAIREEQREMGYEYGTYVSPIHEGDIDHTRYFQALRKAGYTRDLCLEDESLGKYPVEERKANLRAAAEFFLAHIQNV